MTAFGATGHQVIPPAARHYVARRVKDAITHAGVPISVITSLAAGADQLVAQEVLNAGGTLFVVLPCSGYERTFEREIDRVRFQELLSRSVDVERLQFHEPSEEAFWAAGRRVVDRCDVLLAIWDGGPARGLGGTADVVRYATDRHVDVRVIWPDGVSR